MANKELFSNKKKKTTIRKTKEKVTVNEAGGTAYKLKKKAAAAQLVFTGCLNGGFYASAKTQLSELTELLRSIKDPEYIAQLAVLARERGYMKDTPAVCCAILHERGESDLLKKVFPRVMDRQKMLQNFVQMVRSGQFTRKSFGTFTKKLIQDWINGKNEHQLLRGSIGTDPTLVDIINLSHPKPETDVRKNFIDYLMKREFNYDLLPPLVKQYEDFKKDPKTAPQPDLPFQFLAPFNLTTKHWMQIAENMPFHACRMNLNTFERHGVLKHPRSVQIIADKLKDKELILKSKVFPYQLFNAWLNTGSVPTSIKNSLQFAAEIACENIPEFPGNDHIYIFVDTSGSMGCPVTGHRGSATTTMRCVDVAALAACAIMRKHPDRAVLIPFDTTCHKHSINPLDSIMTNAKKLASYGGGGTNCSAPLKMVNDNNGRGDAVIYLSDNESWIDSSGKSARGWGCRGTSTFAEWERFRKKNKGARLVNINLAPYSTTQIPNAGADILNVGGFSDFVFEVMAGFIEAKQENYWVETIKSVEL